MIAAATPDPYPKMTKFVMKTERLSTRSSLQTSLGSSSKSGTQKEAESPSPASTSRRPLAWLRGRLGQAGSKEHETSLKEERVSYLLPAEHSKLPHSREEELVRRVAIGESLRTGDPEQVGALLALYGRLLTQQETTLFRSVLDEMIAERQEQGGSHEL